MTDEEIGREIWLQYCGHDIQDPAKLGAAARAIMGQNGAPEMPSRSDIATLVTARTGNWTRDDGHSLEMRIDLACDVLRHFGLIHKVTAPRAAPRMQIEGMTESAIKDAMHRNAWNPQNENQRVIVDACAKTAHRLANTPMEETPDPDAEAKRLCWIYCKSIAPNMTQEDTWRLAGKQDQPRWRVVAAAKAQP